MKKEKNKQTTKQQKYLMQNFVLLSWIFNLFKLGVICPSSFIFNDLTNTWQFVPLLMILTLVTYGGICLVFKIVKVFILSLISLSNNFSFHWLALPESTIFSWFSNGDFCNCQCFYIYERAFHCNFLKKFFLIYFTF